MTKGESARTGNNSKTKILMASILKAIFIWPQTEADLLSGGTCYASKAEAFVKTSNRFGVIKQQPKEKRWSKSIMDVRGKKKEEAIKVPLKAVPPPSTIPVTPPNICNPE